MSGSPPLPASPPFPGPCADTLAVTRLPRGDATHIMYVLTVQKYGPAMMPTIRTEGVALAEGHPAQGQEARSTFLRGCLYPPLSNTLLVGKASSRGGLWREYERVREQGKTQCALPKHPSRGQRVAQGSRTVRAQLPTPTQWLFRENRSPNLRPFLPQEAIYTAAFMDQRLNTAGYTTIWYSTLRLFPTHRRVYSTPEM